MEIHEKKWNKSLKNEIAKKYFKKIEEKISKDLKSGITIYPKQEKIFAAFEKTPFDKVKVVIL
jgi:uracil-DNA glycosylase